MANSSADEQFDYVGEELALFELADNWKQYLSTRMCGYLHGDLLEVGAGTGANVSYLHHDALRRWVSLEPDRRLCQQYRHRQAEGRIPASCELVHGTLMTLPVDERFDSIIYIDVLEHIEDDREEFSRAYGRLRPGGHLLFLCPAHNFLYSPFDKEIGHFRRYNRQMYRELSSRRPNHLEYLDSIGMAASIANKLLLRQSYPTENQIRLWDRLFVRLSRVFDPLTFRKMGKSILGVWKK